MNASPVSIVLTGIALSVSAKAQPSIQVCGTDLRPGMTKDATLESVSTACEMKHVPTAPNVALDMWCLKRTMKSGPPPTSDDDCPDVVHFKDGKLIGVTKLLGRANGDESAQIINLVYVFLKTASDDGKVATATPMADYESGGWRYRIMQIDAGNRKLTLSTIQPVGKANAISEIKLEESLNAPK